MVVGMRVGLPALQGSGGGVFVMGITTLLLISFFFLDRSHIRIAGFTRRFSFQRRVGQAVLDSLSGILS